MFFKKNTLNQTDFIRVNPVDLPKYGLPKIVEYCSECLMSNQRPNMCPEHYHAKETPKSTIKFENGLCDGCKLAKQKKEIDWEQREQELKLLLDKYRSRNSSYDVVVPGSGGKDSFYVSHLLKYKYNMNPITCTFAPNIYTKWGLENFYSWLDEGFANYKFTCNTKIHKLITRISLENLLHPFQPWILGQKNFPLKFSKQMKIPLIFYGENPAEYGNPNEEYYDNMNMEWHSCEDVDKIYIAGLPIKKIKDKFNLSISDLEPYIPITFNDFRINKIKCVALSYFKNWHPQENYYYTVQNSNFHPSPERTAGTYSKYSSIDDKIDDLHYFTAKIKFGIGRTHYDVAQEIRSNDITTEEGRSLIKKYDGEYPERFEKEIFTYLSLDKNLYSDQISNFEFMNIDKDYFLNLCDNFRSSHIWKKTNSGWVLRKEV